MKTYIIQYIEKEKRYDKYTPWAIEIAATSKKEAINKLKLMVSEKLYNGHKFKIYKISHIVALENKKNNNE